MPSLNNLREQGMKSTSLDDLKKAKIEVLDNNGKKTDEIEVLFNPSQYTLSDSAEYNVTSLPTSDTPQLSFGGGKASTLNMELFFDTSPVLTPDASTSSKASDVSKNVKAFEELVYIKGNLHAPPIVKFVWGSLSFKGVVAEIKSTFTKFMESGMPVQAKVEVSLTAYYEPSESKRKAPFESPDRTKCRMTREDYTIWDIARNEYGDMSKWKIIAKANNISNPLDISPGTILEVPAL